MAIVTNVNMIFLGTFANVDTDESNTSAENENSLLGTYDDLTLTQIAETDADEDGVIRDDEAQTDPEEPDFLSYDVGFGPESYQIDSTMAFTARIVEGDGTVSELTVAVLQTTIGDVFVRDVGNGLDNLNIQSIELISVVNDNFSGSVTGNTIENTSFVCLLEGTLIATPSGPIAIEHLRPGDFVVTHQGTPKRIAHITCQDRTCGPKRQPVVIKTGALGAGLPERDLFVSHSHRIVASSKIVNRMTGMLEVFVAAKHLAGLPGIGRCKASNGLRYFNLLLDKHAVILAEGTPVESLWPGPQVMLALNPTDRAALRRALSEIGHPAALGYLKARFDPPGRVQKQMVWRHKRNGTALLSGLSCLQTLRDITPPAALLPNSPSDQAGLRPQS